ncbi:MAG: hypothetical protein HYV09_01655 [Deltaproteobacteria bacterium]|nr:hypothetical protein [Deltaproteobacteria bacterium]
MRATRLGTAWWRVALAITCLALAAPAVIAGGKALGLAALPLFVAAWQLWVAVRAPEQPRYDGALEADATGLTFRGERFPITELRRARVVAKSDHMVLDLDVGRPAPVRLRMKSANDARAVVKALGLDAGRVRDRFQRATLSTIHRLGLHFGLHMTINMGPLFVGWAVTAAVAPLWVAVWVWLDVQRVEIGPDGIYVHSRLGGEHVPLSRIRGVAATEEKTGILLRLARDGGWPIELRMSAWEAGAFQTRVAELLEYREASAPSAESVLEGRTAAELRALGGRPDTFRAAGIDREALIRIAEMPTAPPPIRARAAIALSASDDEARARVRVIAAQSTLPPLRDALDRVDRDDATVDAALQELDRASR